MRKFSKKFYIRIAIVSCAILFVMALTTLWGGKADFMTNVTNMVVQPVQKGIMFAYNKASGFVDSFMNAGSYAEENELLRADIAKYESIVYSEMEKYKVENERLRALLEMKEKETELDLQGAYVTGIESDNWYSVITIDKGTSSGVKVNDVVTTPYGLVGTVYEVGTTWAKVREVIDVESSISAVCPRTGDRGIIEGDYSLAPYGQVKLNYLPKDANIIKDDRIEISGTGSIYPAGVYIGKVVEIYEDEDGLTLTAIVQSEVRFNSLSEVLVGRIKS